jgi:hypothetical protein
MNKLAIRSFHKSVVDKDKPGNAQPNSGNIKSKKFRKKQNKAIDALV